MASDTPAQSLTKWLFPEAANDEGPNSCGKLPSDDCFSRIC